MTQEEIYNLIKENPGLCTKEIAERLDINITRVCKLIKRMVNKDIKGIEPRDYQLRDLIKKYPTLKYSPRNNFSSNRIKLWVIKK